MIELLEQPLDDNLKKQIFAGLSEHAKAMIGHDEKFDSIVFIADDKGSFAGAIVVEEFWGALHIKLLYINDNYRGKGIGSKLMKKALKYAQDKKCSFAFVETMSFQALDFYRKHGFELEFTRSGYKHGTSFHYLKKPLNH